MPNFAKILPAQAKQGRAVKLGIAADVIIGVGMKVLAVFVAPQFLGLYRPSALTALVLQFSFSRGK